MNYIGPNEGEGIRIYENGTEVVSDTTKYATSKPAADGRIVVGRYNPYEDSYYTTVTVDELIFSNRSLTFEEINYLAT